MPSPNVIRYYGQNCYYHVFNRGVEKRVTFVDDQDYKIFCYYLFIYLAPPEVVEKYYPNIPMRLKKRNLHTDVKLLSYCLMPNHFHFLLLQVTDNATTRFMRRITNAYTKYFNDKYKRVGPLFQGKFKAIGIESEAYLLYLSAYIHQNPSNLTSKLDLYPWSSYRFYLGNQRSTYIESETILSYWLKNNAHSHYRNFVEGLQDDYLPEQYYLDID